MGAIDNSKVSETLIRQYVNSPIHRLLGQLIRVLDERQQIAILCLERSAEHREAMAEMLAGYNNTILVGLGIPTTQAAVAMPNSLRSLSDSFSASERVREMQNIQMLRLREALQQIGARMQDDEGKNITPEMVQRAYQDIANIAAKALNNE